MEKQELKSRWDDLAREIGVQVSPEEEQPVETRSTVSSDETSAAPPAASTAATVSPPPPKPRPADWDKLAGDLGLPAGEPVEAPMEARSPAPPPAKDKEIARRPAAERPTCESKPPVEPRERHERHERRERQEQRERRPDSREKQRPPSEAHREPREKRAREERPREPGSREQGSREQGSREQRSRKQRPRRAEDFVESEGQPAGAIEPPSPPSAPRREEPAKPAAVSLWHKIFGLPAEQSGKLAEGPDTGESDESRPMREESEDFSGLEEVRSLSGSDIVAEGFIEDVERDEESRLTSDDADSTDHKRGRPRRRRRGGRGRKPSERRGERPRAAVADVEPRDPLESGDDFDDLGVSDSDDEFAMEPAPDDDLDADENSDGEPIDASDVSRGKAAQRTIPSWDEAIGFIVDTNMQSRSQRRPPSRGAPSRGRSRGRRKN